MYLTIEILELNYSINWVTPIHLFIPESIIYIIKSSETFIDVSELYFVSDSLIIID